jgi:hypothetical protein
MKEEQIQKLIEEWRMLADRAKLHSDAIIEDGRHLSDEERAKSRGCYDAYAYCIMRLRQEGLGYEW